MHTDALILTWASIVRTGALVRVLDIEPVLMPRMACPGGHSPAMSRRALFQTKLKLARHGTDCGWASKSPHSASQQCRSIHLRRAISYQASKTAGPPAVRSPGAIRTLETVCWIRAADVPRRPTDTQSDAAFRDRQSAMISCHFVCSSQATMAVWLTLTETVLRFKRSLGSIGARIDEVHTPNDTESGIRKRICFQLLSVLC